MPDMERTRTLGDGTRVIEKFTGNPIPKELLKEALWQKVVDLQPGEVYSGFVRVAADISVAEHPRDDADGVLLEIGGIRIGISIDQLEAALPAIHAAIDAKKGKRDARIAAEAAAKAAAALETAEPLDAPVAGAEARDGG